MLGEPPNQAEPRRFKFVGVSWYQSCGHMGVDFCRPVIFSLQRVIDKLWRFTLISHKYLPLSKIRISSSF